MEVKFCACNTLSTTPDSTPLNILQTHLTSFIISLSLPASVMETFKVVLTFESADEIL